ncbi:ArsR/SmtB family transcription factor [Geomicrobium sediminis]|uniref:ArsR family transcriptional regulator n=1 Tax=Geomicrobium sediminis TaxID=1347788 RepID=A0ABS2P6A3_9BACL|nr:metalloregulator ArsR/SmtB family transcription factor [Geomicrobium sediminis]MBM7630935.1 ArsR family transcriptional regulator [Geomicrobium sediminis]
MNQSYRLSSEEIATYTKVMSDPTRLLIIKLVSKKEYCVCQFVEMFEMSQPSISQHLKKLKSYGLVEETRRGQWRFYSLNTASDAIGIVHAIINQISDQDERYIELINKERPVDCG